MTSPKCNTTVLNIPEDEFVGFAFSARNQIVDYKQIMQAAIDAVGAPIAAAFAIRACLASHNLKEGSTVTINGKTHFCKEILSDIYKHQAKDTSIGAVTVAAGGKGIGKNSDKKLVSVARLARAFASTVSAMVKARKITVPDDALILADGTSLPNEYCFLDAPYGMTNEMIVKHYKDFIVFCDNFNKSVRISYDTGGLESTTGRARDHVADFVNYVKWRGIKIPSD